MTEQKTAFLSYRRDKSRHLARAIYMDLRSNGWDVFFDVNAIDSGDFDRIILNQIAARAHFILLISPDALARCVNEGDWVLQEIREAVRLNRNIVPIIEEGSRLEKELSYLPVDLRAVIGKKNAVALYHDYFEAAMDKLRTRFLKAPAYVEISTPPAAEQAEIERRMEAVDTPAPVPVISRTVDTIPNPIEWIDIPLSANLPAYRIAKYPVTNAQFAVFIEAGGYNEQKWWTGAGWSQRESSNWTQPRYWTDAKFNGALQPVVGVSWYEAVAFEMWLKEVSGDNITLPTEKQWQYAAQGDDGREYPWGNEWDGTRCNNRIDKNVSRTTRVTQFEGVGDSPFGVVDMAGNVWEWCLTLYDRRTEELDSKSRRVLRGGSWINKEISAFHCNFRGYRDPYYRETNFGFRLVNP
jgi:hypothetical protein